MKLTTRFGSPTFGLLGRTTATMTAVVASLALCGTANAAIIYSQQFSDVPSGTIVDMTATLLDDTAVEVGSGTWQAGSLFETDGTIEVVSRSSAILPFSPVAGDVYTAKARVSLTNLGFLGFGFANETTFTGNSGGQNNNNAFRFVSGNTIGEGWLMINGTTNFAIPYATGVVAADAAVSQAYPASDPVVELEVVLDTTGTNWVTTYKVDGTSLGTHTWAGANTSIDSVGFASGNGSGVISDFQLSDSAIPEPSSIALLALMGIGGLAMVRRRD